jgi:hypothetical protein
LLRLRNWLDWEMLLISGIKTIAIVVFPINMYKKIT